MSLKSIIVAVGNNGEIGKGNDLMWSQKDDMRLFKEYTMESEDGKTKAVIMGNKTWTSIPAKFRPLPKRKNVILSRMFTGIQGSTVANSIDNALELTSDIDEVFFIGGASVYSDALKIVDQVIITRIHADFPDADVFFSETVDLGAHGFEKTSNNGSNEANERNQYPWTLEIWKRK